MPALKYAKMGGIDNTTRTTSAVPSTARSHDRNSNQVVAFKCDSSSPFSGIVHIQGTTSADTDASDVAIWFDVVQLDFDNEGGTGYVEFSGEYSSIRATAKTGNIYAAAYSNDSATVATSGTFTINGISIIANSGDTTTVLANTINTNAAVILAGNIVASVESIPNVGNSVLRIITNDGSDLVLADTTNTPLADIGITAGTYKTGRIASIQALR